MTKLSNYTVLLSACLISGWTFGGEFPKASKLNGLGGLREIPRGFEPAAGDDLRYQGIGLESRVSLAPDGALLEFPGASAGSKKLRIRFPGSAKTSQPESPLPFQSHRYVGPAKDWRVNVPRYERVRYPGVFPGVDVVYYRNDRQLEYDFVLQPGVDPASVEFSLEGAESFRLDDSGDLIIKVGDRELRQFKPVIFQELPGGRKLVDGGYELRPSGGVGFRVGTFDPQVELTIDPIVYFGYLGFDNIVDSVRDVTVDASGNAYALLSPVEGSDPLYVAKISADGSQVLWGTQIGGSGTDRGNAIGLDSMGNVYITGQTFSQDFPTTLGAYDETGNVDFTSDAFAAKLNASGVLVYATYLGEGEFAEGTNSQSGMDIQVDSSGAAYVVGESFIANIPTTDPLLFDGNANFPCACEGGSTAFLYKLSPDGSSLDFGVIWGGGDSTGQTVPTSLKLDSQGKIVVGGWTEQFDFPITDGAFQTSQYTFGQFTGFVTKIDEPTNSADFSTFVGSDPNIFNFLLGQSKAPTVASSSATDGPAGFVVSGNKILSLDLGSDDSIYIGGSTDELIACDPGFSNCDFGFPVPPSFNGFRSGFVGVLDSIGTDLNRLVYLGGTGHDDLMAMGLGTGGVIVAGSTASSDFPVLQALQPASGGSLDCFVTALTAPLFLATFDIVSSTYLGGTGDDSCLGLGVITDGRWVVGGATSSDGLGTPGSFDPTFDTGGEQDGFVAGLVVEADLAITKMVDNPTPDEGDQITFTITLTNNGPEDIQGEIYVVDDEPAGLNFTDVMATMGEPGLEGGAFWFLQGLDQGATATLTITALVDLDAGGNVIVNEAHVDFSSLPDPDLSNNSATATVAVGEADLEITKTVDVPFPVAGDTVTYTVTLTNNGKDPVFAPIVVQDVLPAGVTLEPDGLIFNEGTSVGIEGSTITWTVNGLQVMSSEVLQIIVTVDQGTEGQVIVNTAAVTDSPIVDPDPSNNADSATIGVGRADLVLTKTVNIMNPDAGDAITYTITLTNSGPDPVLAPITVEDLEPAGLTFTGVNPSAGMAGLGVENEVTWTIPNLGFGESVTLQIFATVNENSGGRVIANTASVTDSPILDPMIGNNSSTAVIGVGSADLALAKTVNDSFPQAEDQISYFLTITNDGPDPLFDTILVQDFEPAGISFLEAIAPDGTQAGFSGEPPSRLLSWIIPQLEVGESLELEILALVNVGTEGQVIENTADIVSVSPVVDPNSGNNSGTVVIGVGEADLAVEKIVDNPKPDEGDQIIYTVTLSNVGPDPVLAPIMLGDLQPAGVTFTGVMALGDTEASLSNGLVTWNLPGLGAGLSEALQITALVNPGFGGQIVINTASVVESPIFDPNPLNNSDSVPIGVGTADLAVEKTVDNANPAAGEEITYTITLTNNGPDPVPDSIIVQDLQPVGVTFTAANPLGETEADLIENLVTWYIPGLAVGESEALEVVALVDETSGGLVIINTATITQSPIADPVGSNDSASAVVGVGSADLGLVKTVDEPFPLAEDQITYQVTITNNGPDPIFDTVLVQDLEPEGVTFLEVSAPEGTEAGLSGESPQLVSWTIPQLDLGESLVLEILASVQSGTEGQVIENTAEIVSTSPVTDPNPANNSSTIQIGVGRADLEVQKTVDNLNPGATDAIVYTVTLTNNGPDPVLAPITVEDLQPAGVTFTGTNASGDTEANIGAENRVTWNIPSLALGEAATLQIFATVDESAAGRIITNTAVISQSPILDPNGENDAGAIAIGVGTADLGLMKTVSDAFPLSPSMITYSVTITNNGPGPIFDTTLVRDDEPMGILFLEANAPEGTTAAILGGVTFGSAAPAGVLPRYVRWTIPQMDAGESLTLEIVAQVLEGTGGQIIDNTASITSQSLVVDPNPDNDSATVSIAVGRADLAVSKVVNNPAPNPGDSILYTVTLTNTGPDPVLAPITVQDARPAGITFTGVIPSDGTEASISGVDGGVTWNLGGLGAGQSATLQISASVLASAGGELVTNTAAVSSSPILDPNPGNNSGSVAIDVGGADLVVEAMPQSLTVDGSEIYQISVNVRNDGVSEATFVSLTHQAPVGIEFVGFPEHDSGSCVRSENFMRCDIGTLLPGQGALFVYTFQALTVGNRSHLFQAASVGGGDLNLNDNFDLVMVSVLPSADLVVAKSALVEGALPGRPFTFRLDVANLGPATASSVVLTDLLPAGLTFVSADHPGCSESAGEVSCSLGNLNSGASLTVLITVGIPELAEGEFTNLASVISSTPDPVEGNNGAEYSFSLVLPGDLNSDGVVNAQDVVILVLEIGDGDGENVLDVAGGTYPGNRAFDVNGDGFVNSADQTALMPLLFPGNVEPQGVRPPGNQ